MHLQSFNFLKFSQNISSQSSATSEATTTLPELSHDYSVVSNARLLSLLSHCPDCYTLLDKEFKQLTFVGGAPVISYECQLCGPDRRWNGQDTVEGGSGHLFDGNLRLAVAIYTCGVPIPVRKVSQTWIIISAINLTPLLAQRLLDMGRLMNLKLPSERTLRDTISSYAVPATSEFYEDHMRIVQTIVQNVNVSE